MPVKFCLQRVVSPGDMDMSPVHVKLRDWGTLKKW